MSEPVPSPSSSSSSPASPPTPPAPQPLLLQPLSAEALDRRRAVRVGVIAIVALLLLLGAFAVTGPLRVLSGKRVDVDFAFCGPIKPGASVRLAGVVVGVVDDVVLLAGRDPAAGPDAMVRVSARIEDRAAHLLTSGTKFYVTTLGVLGEHYLDVAPGPGAPLGDGSRVDGITLARADLLLPRASALLDRADALLPSSPEAQRFMTTATTLMAALDAVLKDDEAKGQLKDGVRDARALVDDLRALVKGAATGIGDGRALRATLEGLPPVLDKTGKLEDQLLAAELGAFLAETRGTLKRADTLIAALSQGPAADPAEQKKLTLQLSTTLLSLDAAAQRADRLLGKIERREGAAGKLFHDDEFAADLKALLKTVREDPLKLLFR